MSCCLFEATFFSRNDYYWCHSFASLYALKTLIRRQDDGFLSLVPSDQTLQKQIPLVTLQRR